MTVPETRPEQESRPEDLHDPWQGIPGELLDGTYSYDLDCEGGCG
jgi:hypothetical protein